MRYRGSYSNYRGGDGNETYGRRMRDSRGRYMEGSYGRRGVDSKYRDGYEHMEDMQDSYERYEDSMGRYGAGQESMSNLEDVLDSTYKMLKTLSDKSENQEEMELIKEYTQKMSRL